MYCIKCGGEVIEESKFCHHCGRELVKLERQGVSSQGKEKAAGKNGERQTSTNRKQSPSYRKPIAVGMVIGIIAVLLVSYYQAPGLGASSSHGSPSAPYSPQVDEHGSSSNSGSTDRVSDSGGNSSSSNSGGGSNGSSSGISEVERVDGELRNVQIPSSVDDGESLTASVTARNSGNVGKTFKVKLESSSTSTSERVYLSEGDSEDVELTIFPDRGDSKATLSLYADGELLDSQESSVAVQYVEGEIVSASVPSTLREGDASQVSVTVMNTGNKNAYLQIKLDPNYSSSASRRVQVFEGSTRTVSLDIELDRNDTSIDVSLIYDWESLDTTSKSVDVDYDEDGDGLYNSRESELGTDSSNVDTDGDGLSDQLEVETLASYGADPLRRDIFVEIDRMDGVGRLSGVQEWRLKNSFEDAPLKNPDGSWGVDLHLYYDDVITPGESIDYSPDEGSNEFWEYKRRYHDYPDGFRWALFAGIKVGEWWEVWKQAPGGVAWGEGFMMDRGRLFLPAAHTFMHELGHSLGLTSSVYDGIDSYDWPWDYSSVMNYGSQLYSLGAELDYSRGGDFNDWEYLGNGFTNYWGV